MLALTGCDRPAEVAANFEFPGRVIFVNGITDKYLLLIEGLCAIGHWEGVKAVTVTCKTGPNDYKKHYLGLADNVTYVAEQIDSANVSPYKYRVLFHPQNIIPDVGFDVR